MNKDDLHYKIYGNSEVLGKEIECQIAQYIDMLKNGTKYPHEKVWSNRFFKNSMQV